MNLLDFRSLQQDEFCLNEELINLPEVLSNVCSIFSVHTLQKNIDLIVIINGKMVYKNANKDQILSVNMPQIYAD